MDGSTALPPERDGKGALDELLDAFGEPLYMYFSLMIADRDHATRALADTITVALTRHGDRIAAAAGDVRVWVYGLARQEFENYRRTRQSAVPDTLASLRALPSASVPDLSLAETAFLALSRLEVAEREALIFCSPSFGLNPDELAALFRTTAHAAAFLCARANARFCEMIPAAAGRAGPGEVLQLVSALLVGDVPARRVRYMCTDEDLSGRRRAVVERSVATDSVPSGPAFGMPGPAEPVSPARVPRRARHRRRRWWRRWRG